MHVVFYCELDPDRERLWRVRAFFDVYDAAVQLGVLPARGTLGERALLHAARLRAARAGLSRYPVTVSVAVIPGWIVHTYLIVPAFVGVN